MVGDDIYTVESGIITGWWRRLEKFNKPLEMYAFLPELVGHEGVNIILGKKSGRDSILYMAVKHGIKLNDDVEVDRLLQKVKEKALENKRPITEEEFLSLATDQKQQVGPLIKICCKSNGFYYAALSEACRGSMGNKTSQLGKLLHTVCIIFVLGYNLGEYGGQCRVLYKNSMEPLPTTLSKYGTRKKEMRPPPRARAASML